MTDKTDALVRWAELCEKGHGHTVALELREALAASAGGAKCGHCGKPKRADRALDACACATLTYTPQPAEGGQGEAVELTKCCGREECGGECGNEWRGTEWVRKATQPAASVDVDVDCLKQIRALLQSLPGAQGREHIDLGIRLNRLIDAAGGAKGGGDPGEFGVGIAPNPKARYWQERADFWRGQAIALGYDPEATPQPAEGDGTVAGYISKGELKILRNPDWGGARIVRTQHDEYQIPLYTRPAATAADAWIVGVTGWTKADGKTLWMEHDGEPVFRSGKHDDLGPNRAVYMEATLPAALAQQEPRHDALADGEAASA